MRLPRSDAAPSYDTPSGTASDRRQRPKSSVRICWKRACAPCDCELQALLLEHVQPDEAEVADVFLHQVRNVVVAHEQHVERHVLAVRHELVLAARDLQSAAQQQVERGVGEPAGLLHGELEAAVIHGGGLLRGLPLRLRVPRRVASSS